VPVEFHQTNFAPQNSSVEGDFFETRQSKLVHHDQLKVGKAVNKSQAENRGSFDFISGFALFTGFPQARFGEQRVHINSLSV